MFHGCSMHAFSYPVRSIPVSVSSSAPFLLVFAFLAMLLLDRALVAFLPIGSLDANGSASQPGLVLFPNGLGAFQGLQKTHKAVSLGFVRCGVANNLGHGHAGIPGGKMAVQGVVVHLGAQVADKNPKVVFGPFRQGGIDPGFSRGHADDGFAAAIVVVAAGRLRASGRGSRWQRGHGAGREWRQTRVGAAVGMAMASGSKIVVGVVGWIGIRWRRRRSELLLL